MRAATALTKDAPALTEAERLDRIQRWTKSAAAENRSGATRDVLSDIKKIRTTLDPKDYVTSRMVVNEFERFIQSKRENSDRKVQFSRTENRQDVVGIKTEFDKAFENNHNSIIRPHSSVDEGQARRHSTHSASKSSRHAEPNTSKAIDDSNTTQRSDHRDPAWWHRKIRQGYLETEEMISKLVYQRKAEEKQLGVKAPSARVSEYVSRKFPHTNHERRRLDRSMERLRKKHEACFGKPLTASELDSMSGRGTTEQRQKKRRDAISRVSGVHVPASTHITRDPIPLPKTMTSHLEDNWTPPKFPRSTSQANKSKEAAENLIGKTDIKILYERPQNGRGATTPEKSISRKNNSEKSEWVERLYEAKAKKVNRQAEADKEVRRKEKEGMNALYKELVMNKRRLSKNEQMHKDWRGKKVPSWRMKQLLAGGVTHGTRYNEGSKDSDKSTRPIISTHKWDAQPPKGLGMWLEGVLAKAKVQRDLARGAPGPVTEAFMRPLASYHF